MSSGSVDAIVIGGGYIGLTTALAVAEAGLQVAIWAARPPRQTTSAAAGAIWAPYDLEPLDQVASWRAHTHDVLRQLAHRPGTGVRLSRGVEASRTPIASVVSSDQVEGFSRCQPSELPAGYLTGFRFTTPLVDMPVHLAYLEGRLACAGVTMEIRQVASLTEAAARAPVVVNCTGIGARDLVPDPQVTPIRGQVVVVENPGLTEFFSEDSAGAPEQCYIYPQGATVVLGGVADPGKWSLEPDPDVAAGIVARCVAVEPRLRGARVIEHRVGLRPGRPQVRVEEDESIRGTRVIHNYGHGRAGVTLSWGCASAVATMARSVPGLL